MIPFIPVNEPALDGNEELYLLESLRSGWISSEGPSVRDFEMSFAARIGCRQAIAVCNGTAALEVAVAALKLGPGDEVILPTFTIISCAAAILRSGATPVLVDCDPLTWTMDVGQAATRITASTRAIMPVHIYGLPVNMNPLLELATHHGLVVIEDAAEAHGLMYAGRACGNMGTLGTFSFYPNKLVTTGEGGMVVTDDERLAERCRSLRNLCFQAERRFVHEELGFNFRMTSLQAALGRAQLERWDEFVRRKQEIGTLYQSLLAGCPGIQLPVEATEYADNGYWVFGIVLDDHVPLSAAEMMARLAARGIGTRPFFWPMHEQPVFNRMGLFRGEVHPVAERIARRGFYLPSGLALRPEQIQRVCDEVKNIMYGMCC